MKYDEVRKNPTSFLALTRVCISLFDEILPFFTDAHDEYFRWHDIKGKRLTRQRCHVIQSNSPLPTVADRLFFLLTYLKNNPTQEYHAAMFDMSQQQCGQWIHTLTDILRMALEEAGVLPANTVSGFKRLLDQRGGAEVVHELIHDGTEREIPRPSNPELQKEYYSRKKKKHTVKNTVITCLAGFTIEGTMHDKKIADTQYSFPYKCVLQQDTGYQGYTPENVTILQPMKKPRGKELTDEQKAANAEISKTRIKVEHEYRSSLAKALKMDDVNIYPPRRTHPQARQSEQRIQRRNNQNATHSPLHLRVLRTRLRLLGCRPRVADSCFKII